MSEVKALRLENLCFVVPEKGEYLIRVYSINGYHLLHADEVEDLRNFLDAWLKEREKHED